MTHIMLDIETLGKKPGCVVLSVALVRFADLASCSVVLDMGEQRLVGLTDDPETVAWWRQQSLEAQAAVTDGAQSVVTALEYIQQWLAWSQFEFIWCHGAGFDAPILQEVFERFGFMVPWHYAAVRDTRTLYDLAGVDLTHFSEGPRHIALNDAMAQTKAALVALGKLAPR